MLQHCEIITGHGNSKEYWNDEIKLLYEFSNILLKRVHLLTTWNYWMYEYVIYIKFECNYATDEINIQYFAKHNNIYQNNQKFVVQSKHTNKPINIIWYICVKIKMVID